ncbi:MAG TPA: carboxypeptidase regulatory-like domain-containing protein, partial [Chondromyces sp.]|nr:carboxypeptidase regulatory-like domain-containing protein [Chondromyces sp.]
GLAQAQGVTTGSLSGVVRDPSGALVPGVTVVATLEATQTRYATVTDAEGRFRILNVRVGGPYTVEAALPGFQNAVASNAFVRLGEDTNLNFNLQLEAATGEILVVSESSPLIGPLKMGSASSVSEATLDALPSADRNLFDFARTNPVMSTFSPGEDATILTVAGRNNRFNNISIDGAVNNDVFGLAASGTPGGQTQAQPISLDAVQELQLVTSSFDVRQGGFTGGSVNVITKSGTNNWSGSVYGYYADDNFVNDIDELGSLGTFEDQEYGFTLGGKLIRDKAFFFVSYETRDLSRPTGYSLDGTGGTCYQGCQFTEEAAQFRQHLIDNYGYDPGGLGQVTSETPNDKFFVRFDFNLNPSNNLVLRHNYIDASNFIIRPSNSSFQFPNNGYDFLNETNSTVAQWNAVWGDGYFNEMRLTYQTIRDKRSSPTDPFPSISIRDPDGNGNDWEAGFEPFSTANALDQDIFEFTNDFTFFAGDHEIVIGTHNEWYSFYNLFIQQSYGDYTFNTLDDFYSGFANQFDYTFPNDPANPADTFDHWQFSLYAGDTWRVKPNLTLVGGLRLDIPYFPDTPDYNPLVEDTFGTRTDQVPDGNMLWSPRVGFNWDISGNSTKQLRGGVGLFTGRTPFVWISNNYGRTGTRQTTIRAFGSIEFNPDPFDQPTDVAGASRQDVNTVDPDFEFPQTWRANLAYDHKLPWWDMVASAEVMYSSSVNEVTWKDLNLVQTGETIPFDGRPVYERLSSTFSGNYFLTNTNEGDATNLIFKLEKPYGASSPLWGSVAYAWGESNVINDATSSRAVSNFQFNEAADPNNPELSPSDFEVRHRATVNLNYEFNRASRWSTVLSVFWNRQAGRPYMNIFFGNFPTINGDQYFSNDPFYVPSGADDVVITNGTWDQLNNYIELYGLDKFRGQIAPRNSLSQPYVTQTDLSIRQNIPVPGSSSLQVLFDIYNFWNMIDEDSGWVRYVPFGTVQPVTYVGASDDGKPIYTLRNVVLDPEANSIFSVDNLRSRWRMRLGVRWSF